MICKEQPKYFALITKPLQFFNVTNLENSDSFVYLIINTFLEANLFFERLKKKNVDVVFFDVRQSAYFWLYKNSQKGDFIYLDSDYGIQNTLLLFPLKNREIYVYEEGIGSYRNNIFSTSKLIRKISKFLGSKNHLGSGRFTKGIYVYDIEKHKDSVKNFSKERKEFKNSFINHLENFRFRDLIHDEIALPFEEIKNRKVLLYLTSWNFNEKIFELIDAHPDYLTILKPHPHIMNINVNYSNIFDFTISGTNMVEFLIYEVNKYAKETIIVHEGTSSLMYFRNLPNIIDIRL